MTKENIVVFAKKMLASMNKTYFVRAYAIGIIYFAFFYMMGSDKNSSNGFSIIAMSFICWVLYPFSKMVWDELTNLFIGGTVWILPLIPLYIWKLAINFILFTLSIFVAPIGLLILYFHSKKLFPEE